MSDTIETRTEEIGSGVAKLDTSPISQSLAIKASSENEDPVLVAGSEASLEAGDGWPLEPGEKIAVDLKGSAVFYKGTEGEKLHVMVLAP